MSSKATAPAARSSGDGLGRIGDLLGLVEQLEDALGRGDRRLHDVGDAGRLDDRERELARVLDERDDVAQRQLPRGDPQAADDGDGHVVEVGDEVHRRLDDPGDELGAVARLVQPVVLLVEPRDRLFLAAEHLDDGVAGVHLLDVAVERPGRGPLRDELLLRAARDEHGDDDRDRHRQQRDDRQDRIDREHQDQDPDDGQQRGDQLGQALLERLADVVDVVGDPAQDVAAGMAVEVLERQPAELLVGLAAEPVDGPLRDAGHDVGLSPAEDRAQQVDTRQQQQDLAERPEVDAVAGRQVHARRACRRAGSDPGRAARRPPGPGSRRRAGSC